MGLDHLESCWAFISSSIGGSRERCHRMRSFQFPNRYYDDGYADNGLRRPPERKETAKV